MAKIYFDITDIIYFARRSNRLTGIQRVEFNLINLLAKHHGGQAIQCVFFHPQQRAYVEFDPTARSADREFDAERLLIDLGLVRHSSRYPSSVRIKTYLRAHARNKLHRAWLRAYIYLLAWLSPARLAALDLGPSANVVGGVRPELRRVMQLPVDSHLVHLGSSWLFPETWGFAAQHKARGGDVVQYVHDLIPVTHPHFMPPKEPSAFVHWLEEALDYATRFPCNSQWTADSLRHFAVQRGLQPAVHVVPLAHEFAGFARRSDPELPAQLQDLAGKRFVLCVGTIEARKNGLSLLQAWEQLSEELGDKMPLLVFAGRYGKIGGAAVRDYIATHETLKRLVRVIDSPSDQILAWLYRNCLFSAYPSHVEGWGLPVGESAWFGRYCVASKSSSIPEVCGELVGYVDPNDLTSIKDGLVKTIHDTAYLLEREAAIAGAPLRTWQNVADDLYRYVTNRSAL